MFDMFSGARAFNQPLANWDVSSVTDMSNMFHFAVSFNQPLDAWDLSSATDMGSMFRGSRFNQNLCSWGEKITDQSIETNLMFWNPTCPQQRLTNLTSEVPGPFCFECGLPPPVGTEAISAWEVGGLGRQDKQDICTVDDKCIASHPLVGVARYANLQSCGFTATVNGTLKVEVFLTELDYDFLHFIPLLGGEIETLSGRDGFALDGRSIVAGTRILWQSDKKNEDGSDRGWKICLEE